MAKYRIGLNMEYCRSADMSFEAGVKQVARMALDQQKESD